LNHSTKFQLISSTHYLPRPLFIREGYQGQNRRTDQPGAKMTSSAAKNKQSAREIVI